MRFCLALSIPARLAFCVAFAGCIQAQLNPKLEPDTPDTYLRRQMVMRHVPGMQVVVVNHGSIVLSRGYGMASLQDEAPVTKKRSFLSIP